MAERKTFCQTWALHAGKLVGSVLKSPSIRTVRNKDSQLKHEECIAFRVNRSSNSVQLPVHYWKLYVVSGTASYVRNAVVEYSAIGQTHNRISIKSHCN